MGKITWTAAPNFEKFASQVLLRALQALLQALPRVTNFTSVITSCKTEQVCMRILVTLSSQSKGRTIRKVMGGVGKKPKKIHARENAKKKNSCKEEGKKKFHAEGRSNPRPCYININNK